MKSRNVAGQDMFGAQYAAGNDKFQTNTDQCNEKNAIFMHSLPLEFGTMTKAYQKVHKNEITKL